MDQKVKGLVADFDGPCAPGVFCFQLEDFVQLRRRPDALAAALLVELGLESYPLLFSPQDREVLLWRLREAVGWQILPYALLALLVPFVRLPASSRWVLIIGFFIVGGIGIFELGRLGFGGGEVGFVAYLCWRAQVGAAAAATVLALVAKAVQHLFAKKGMRNGVSP